MLQEPDSILAMVAGRGHELVQDAAFLGFAGSRIAQANRQDQLALAQLGHGALPLSSTSKSASVAFSLRQPLHPK